MQAVIRTKVLVLRLLCILEQAGQQEGQQVVQLPQVILQGGTRQHDTPTAACTAQHRQRSEQVSTHSQYRS